MTTPASEPPEKDDLSRSMDKWQVSTALRLQADYGHSHDVAWGLAAMSRWEIETGLRKPGPLIIITGI